MGTDIHSVAQVRNDDGTWETVGPVFIDSYYHPEWPARDVEWNQPLTHQPFRDRHYTCFAALADVRNGTGFAGVDTGDPLDPISEPRGLPDDFSTSEHPDYGENYHSSPNLPEPVYMGDHSYSWLLLSEMLAYDWDQTIVKRGFITAPQIGDLLKGGQPSGWCGGVSGRDITTKVFGRDHKGASVWLSSGHDGCRAQVEWTTTLADYTQPLQRSISTLHRLVARRQKTSLRDADTAALRMVFGFDS